MGRFLRACYEAVKKIPKLLTAILPAQRASQAEMESIQGSRAEVGRGQAIGTSFESPGSTF